MLKLYKEMRKIVDDNWDSIYSDIKKECEDYYIDIEEITKTAPSPGYRTPADHINILATYSRKESTDIADQLEEKFGQEHFDGDLILTIYTICEYWESIQTLLNQKVTDQAIDEALESDPINDTTPYYVTLLYCYAKHDPTILTALENEFGQENFDSRYFE